MAFAKHMAVELGQDKIRVNVVCPGAFDTEIWKNTYQERCEEAQFPIEFPQGKAPCSSTQKGDPRHVAKMVAWLASEDSMHVSGAVMHIDAASSLTH